MPKIAIDPSSFFSVPRVVATVHRLADLDAPIAPGCCDLLEFRLDNLSEVIDAAERGLAASPLPCLITARHPAEGGAGGLETSQRRDLLFSCLPHAALADIEVRSLDELADAAAAARDLNVALVASFHDFEKTPPTGELEAAIAAADAAGADVVKIAVRLHSIADLAALAVLTERTAASGRRISAMGMGPLGKVSRLVLAAAGSCLNYGYLHEPNAPGQWPAAELMARFREIGVRGD